MPAIRGSESKKKTRRKRRDLDQIHSDLHVAGHLDKYKQEKAAEDLPGLGQWYCTECAKWFDQEDNLNKHLRSKLHKKRYVRNDACLGWLWSNRKQGQGFAGAAVYAERS